MNDCPNGEMRDLLPDLLHGRLGSVQRAAVEAHVASCADCRAELALLGELRATLRRAPAVDVASIVSALPAYRAPARSRFTNLRAAAAIAAIAIGGTSIAIATRNVSVGPATSTTPAAPVVVARGMETPVSAHGAPAVGEDSQTAAPTARVAQTSVRHELSVSGSVAELSDGELASLLKGIESLEAVPSAEAEPASLAPAAELASTTGES